MGFTTETLTDGTSGCPGAPPFDQTIFGICLSLSLSLAQRWPDQQHLTVKQHWPAV